MQPEVKKIFAQPPVVIIYIIGTQKYYHKKSTHFSIIFYFMPIYDPKLNIAFTFFSSRVLHVVIINYKSIKNSTVQTYVTAYRLDQVLSKSVKFPSIQRTLAENNHCFYIQKKCWLKVNKSLYVMSHLKRNSRSAARYLQAGSRVLTSDKCSGCCRIVLQKPLIPLGNSKSRTARYSYS